MSLQNLSTAAASGTPVIIIELYALSDGKKYCGEDEYRRLVLEFVATIDTRVKWGQFFEYVFLELAPYVGHGLLYLEVDHDRCHNFAIEPRSFFLHLADQPFFIKNTLHHGDMQSEIVEVSKTE
jgi:hypothetical protein